MSEKKQTTKKKAPAKKVISEEEKQLLIDNMNVVNSRMQQFYITIRIVESRPKYNESVVQSLKEFYKELNKK